MVESCDNANESAEFTATNNTTATGGTGRNRRSKYIYSHF